MSNNQYDKERALISLAQSTGHELLQALVTEIRLMPDVWQKLSQAKQDEVIERMRKQVTSLVTNAVYSIAADGRFVVVGLLDQVTIKKGAKAVVTFPPGAENLPHLYGSEGKDVVVVVANPDDYMTGMDQITGEDDQRKLFNN
jgi:hypothetical protein